MTLPAPYLMPWMIALGRSRMKEALWCGQTKRRMIALTFDDGPSRFTPGLLDVLRNCGVPATFFVLGNRVAKFAATLQRAQAEGHLIGLHGCEHKKIKGLGREELLAMIEKNQKQVSSILGRKSTPWYYRPPHGRCSLKQVNWLEAAGVRTVLLTCLPGQQMLPSGWREEPEPITRRVLRDLEPGAIIGLHDGQALPEPDYVYDSLYCAEVAESLIKVLRQKSYEFVTVEEMDKERA